MNIEDLSLKADKFNRDEINKYKAGYNDIYKLTLEAGIKLARYLNADELIVKIGIAMSDSKLPEAISIGEPKKHIIMAIDATKEMLKDADIPEEKKQNIIKCVEEHHGVDNFYSIESEIVCNADCYKFIHPKGVFDYCSLLGRRLNNLPKELEQLEYKMDEKYNALSLSIAKQELETYYKDFKNLISKTKE